MRTLEICLKRESNSGIFLPEKMAHEQACMAKSVSVHERMLTFRRIEFSISWFPKRNEAAMWLNTEWMAVKQIHNDDDT